MTIKEYFESQRWKFATTYAMFAPHEYILRAWMDDKESFDKAVRYIQKYGMKMYYYKSDRQYLFVGGWFYWALWSKEDLSDAIINRCRPEDYDIVFMKRGTQARAIAAKNSKLESAKEPPTCEQIELEL